MKVADVFYMWKKKDGDQYLNPSDEPKAFHDLCNLMTDSVPEAIGNVESVGLTPEDMKGYVICRFINTDMGNPFNYG